MTYYVLKRGEDELYAMNLLLSEDEAEEFGHAGQDVMVKAIFIWTERQRLEDFRAWLSIEQSEPGSAFRGLIDDMRAGRVEALELRPSQLRTRLKRYRSVQFVALNPGAEQRVEKAVKFMRRLA